MSHYLKQTKGEITFDGDVVSFVLNPILYQDTLKVNSLPTIVDENGKESIDGQLITELMQELVPRYLVSISGLKDAEGNALQIADILGVAYFTGLITQIGSSLLIAGTPPNPASASDQSAS